LVVALPPGHALLASAEISLADLAGDRFVGLRPTTVLRRQVDALCVRAGFEPTIAFESDDLQTVRGFVAAGLGVAVVPATPGSIDAERSPSTVPLSDPQAFRDIGLVWSVSRRLLPSARLFREHVLRRASAGALSAQ
jgi:DNA-binding transcriptional LysR family regulator